MRNLKAIAALLLVLCAATAHAEESTAEKIKRINEQTALLDAELRQLETQEKVAQKKSDISHLSGTASSDDATPVVKSIGGMDEQLNATLLFQGGVTQTVSKGDVLPNGWKVLSITGNKVDVARGSQRKSLIRGNAAPVPETQSQGHGAVPMPPNGIPGMPR